jgi:glycosyltransferase involved in cell wall biosynthesis
VNPVASIVIPSYNYARYLRECLDSALGQRVDADFEVIVVDDASTDDSLAIIDSYRDTRLRVVRHERNAGHVATINEGFALARGEYIARIDSDDRYHPDFLAEALRIFRRHEDVGLVYGDVRLIDGQGIVQRDSALDVHGGRDYKGSELVALLERNFIPAPTVIARRAAWREALPIPQGLGFSDWYLTLRIARRYDFYYVARPLADYRVHGSGLHETMTRDGSEEATIRRVLAEMFSEDLFGAARERVRRRVYAAQCRTLADKYFWFGMDADARRCYLEAVRNRPGLALEPGLARRLLATVVGRRAYEAAKDAVARRLPAGLCGAGPNGRRALEPHEAPSGTPRPPRMSAR